MINEIYILGEKLLYSLFPPICQGGKNGKIYYIAMFSPIQVRGKHGYFRGGGEWLWGKKAL